MPTFIGVWNSHNVRMTGVKVVVSKSLWSADPWRSAPPNHSPTQEGFWGRTCIRSANTLDSVRAHSLRVHFLHIRQIYRHNTMIQIQCIGMKTIEDSQCQQHFYSVSILCV